MSRRGEEGFVLVAVIWFVALLALAAAVIAGWTARSLGRGFALNQQIAARTEIVGAVNQIAFAMVSGYYSPRGLEVGDSEELAGRAMPNTLAFALRAGTPAITLDNRPYRFGDLVLRLQDDHGLVNVNFIDLPLLRNLLQEYDIPYDDRAVLIDRLLDYTNKSGFVRLNGANADAYLDAGRPPPRGNPLLTPWEAYRVLGWDEYPNLWRGPDPFAEFASTRDLAGINPNTAPEAVLRAISGFDSRAVDRLLRYRSAYVLQNVLDLGRATGVEVLNPLEFTFFPASSLRLTVMAAADPVVHTIEIRLNPMGPAPYRIDYSVDRPKMGLDRAVIARADLPVLPMPVDIR